ncbi:MAG: SIGNAL peptide protein [Thalassobius sp.]|nr:SIGNAL peptide protein [Thalassovita sp.]
MLSIPLYILILIANLDIVSLQPSADTIIGTWLNDEKSANIEIYKEDNKYFGKIVWLKEPKTPEGKTKTDVNNPDRDLRERPIVGLTIIYDLEYDDGEWIDGTVYSARQGRTANCEITIKPDGNSLEITASKFGFSRTKIWTRI